MRNDEHVARTHLDIGRHVAALDKITNAHAVLLVAFGGAQDGGAIAIGKVRDAADRNHDVEQCHLLVVLQHLRICSLAHDADLLAVGADEAGDDDGHDRITDVLGQRLLDVTRKRARILAQGRKVFDQRSGDLAVRADRDGHRQLGVAPHHDVDAIARPDHVVILRVGSSHRRRRVRSGTGRKKRPCKQHERETEEFAADTRGFLHHVPTPPGFIAVYDTTTSLSRMLRSCVI